MEQIILMADAGVAAVAVDDTGEELHRPPALQRQYFAGYADRLPAAHPDWTSRQIHGAASRFVSPPELAPHSAGAAVDLMLANSDGRELDMGCALDGSPEESRGAPVLTSGLTLALSQKDVLLIG
ncbi:MAG TPA: hypothetical protein VH373_00945 [Jatrophihabitantaceae bacterium]